MLTVKLFSYPYVVTVQPEHWKASWQPRLDAPCPTIYKNIYNFSSIVVPAELRRAVCSIQNSTSFWKVRSGIRNCSWSRSLFIDSKSSIVFWWPVQGAVRFGVLLHQRARWSSDALLAHMAAICSMSRSNCAQYSSVSSVSNSIIAVNNKFIRIVVVVSENRTVASEGF